MSLTDKLRAALGRFMGRGAQRGYMYVADAEADAMRDAAAGHEVRVARQGPWLVVDHELSSVVVAKWPGRLWLVEAIDPITPAEMKALGATLTSDAGYTRAAAIRVVEEANVATLFGAHGDAVVKVIAAAQALSLDTATRLSAARDAEAAKAQTRVWKRWLAKQSPPIVERGDDLDGTLSVGRMRSPVGCGLMVVHNEVGKRAEAIAGKTAWIVEKGSDDAWLAEPWAGASNAMVDAALAFGAPELVDEDREILSKAWRSIIGKFE